MFSPIAINTFGIRSPHQRCADRRAWRRFLEPPPVSWIEDSQSPKQETVLVWLGAQRVRRRTPRTICPACRVHWQRPSGWVGNFCRPCKRVQIEASQCRRREENANTNPYVDPSPKTCRRCRASLPRTAFGPEPRVRGGLKASCRPCIRRRKKRQCSASITFPAADIYTSPLCPSG